ncbi:hypothetical protein I4F81_008099 [Pyropia yezoensis]|uniref:Uncharacterized protein n=1 Tax=Pyropia yezoensis TaxID=2788 RepID=A0ACC3C619_PYRYE|nr:hypothetical protein I4F81_008099 [Neopyropia yezoensis]
MGRDSSSKCSSGSLWHPTRRPRRVPPLASPRRPGRRSHHRRPAAPPPPTWSVGWRPWRNGWTCPPACSGWRSRCGGWKSGADPDSSSEGPGRRWVEPVGRRAGGETGCGSHTLALMLRSQSLAPAPHLPSQLLSLAARPVRRRFNVRTGADSSDRQP